MNSSNYEKKVNLFFAFNEKESIYTRYTQCYIPIVDTLVCVLFKKEFFRQTLKSIKN